MTFGGAWGEQVNWITFYLYEPAYSKYGDMLIVYLSSVAPDYRQPIQTIGHSAGNTPAMEVARYVNTTYKDTRYAVNRVSLLGGVQQSVSPEVAQFHTNRVGGEQCWVDNYISNDPNYARRPILPGALNTVCNPARGHSYPLQRYGSSSLEYTNGGLTAFAYLSVIGRGKNYQLNTASQKYYFVINSAESIMFSNQSLYPGKILAPGGKLVFNDARETPDTAAVLFECPGYVFTYEVRHGNGNPPWGGMDHGIEFCGTKAAIWVNRNGYTLFPENDRAHPRQVQSQGMEVQHKRNFLDCVRSRQRPNSDVELGHLGSIPGHLGNIAYRVGRRIKWDGTRENIPDDTEAAALLGRTYRTLWTLPRV